MYFTIIYINNDRTEIIRDLLIDSHQTAYSLDFQLKYSDECKTYYVNSKQQKLISFIPQ